MTIETMTVDRDRAEGDIGNLYGLPGTDWDTGVGRYLLISLLQDLGASALTDDALADLAARHRAHDDKWAGRRDQPQCANLMLPPL